MSLKQLRIHIGFNFFGAGNVGDDLMVAGFLQALGTRIENCQVSCCTPHDLASQARRFPSIRWLVDSDANRIDCIRNAEIWLGLGGTPFQSRSGPWLTEQLLQQASLAQHYGVPMYYLGVGVEDDTVLQDEALISVVRKAEHIWTRDAVSTRTLSNIRRRGISEGADLSHAFLATRGISKSPLKFGLLVASEDPLFSINLKTEVEKFANSRITWLVQDIRSFPGSEISNLSALSPHQRGRISVAAPDYHDAPSAAALIDAWPSSQIVASSRYHGLCIFAWRGTRLLAIQRSGKIAAFAHEFDIPLVHISDLNSSLTQARPVKREFLEQSSVRARAMVDQFCNRVGLGHEQGAGETQLVAEQNTDQSKRGPIQIAIVKYDSIGDFILLSPFLRELRRLHPAADITLYVRRSVAELARLCPYVDRVVVEDELGNLSEMGKFAIPAGGYDVVFVPRAAKDYFRGLKIAHLLGGREVWGFSGTATSGLEFSSITHDVELFGGESHARLNLLLLRDLAKDDLDDTLELWPRKHRIDHWRAKLAIAPNERPLCLIGFDAQNPAFAWPSENFIQIIRRILETYSFIPVLIGESGTVAIALEICSRFPRGAVLNLAGYSLEDVCAVSTFAGLYVGNDTGPKHIAAAAGVPVVEINPYPSGSSAFFEAGPLHFHPHGVSCITLQPPVGTHEDTVMSGAGIRLIAHERVCEAIQKLIDCLNIDPLERRQEQRDCIAKVNFDREADLVRIAQLPFGGTQSFDLSAEVAPKPLRAIVAQHEYIETLERKWWETRAKLSVEQADRSPSHSGKV